MDVLNKILLVLQSTGSCVIPRGKDRYMVYGLEVAEQLKELNSLVSAAGVNFDNKKFLVDNVRLETEQSLLTVTQIDKLVEGPNGEPVDEISYFEFILSGAVVKLSFRDLKPEVYQHKTSRVFKYYPKNEKWYVSEQNRVYALSLMHIEDLHLWRFLQPGIGIGFTELLFKTLYPKHPLFGEINKLSRMNITLNDIIHSSSKRDLISKVLKIQAPKSVSSLPLELGYYREYMIKKFSAETQRSQISKMFESFHQFKEDFGLNLMQLGRGAEQVRRAGLTSNSNGYITFKKSQTGILLHLAHTYLAWFKFGSELRDRETINDFLMMKYQQNNLGRTNSSYIKRQNLDLKVVKEVFEMTLNQIREAHEQLVIETNNKPLKGIKRLPINSVYKDLVKQLEKNGVEIIKTGERLAWEGQTQHHCVGSYASRIKHGDCIIGSVVLNNIRYTLEINYNRYNEKFSINQCKSKYNGRPDLLTKNELDKLFAQTDLFVPFHEVNQLTRDNVLDWYNQGLLTNLQVRELGYEPVVEEIDYDLDLVEELNLDEEDLPY